METDGVGSGATAAAAVRTVGRYSEYTDCVNRAFLWLREEAHRTVGTDESAKKRVGLSSEGTFEELSDALKCARVLAEYEVRMPGQICLDFREAVSLRREHLEWHRANSSVGSGLSKMQRSREKSKSRKEGKVEKNDKETAQELEAEKKKEEDIRGEHNEIIDGFIEITKIIPPKVDTKGELVMETLSQVFPSLTLSENGKDKQQKEKQKEKGKTEAPAAAEETGEGLKEDSSGSEEEGEEEEGDGDGDGDGDDGDSDSDSESEEGEEEVLEPKPLDKQLAIEMLLVDISELRKTVSRIWRDVKRNVVTIMEAAEVTSAGVKMIQKESKNLADMYPKLKQVDYILYALKVSMGLNEKSAAIKEMATYSTCALALHSISPVIEKSAKKKTDLFFEKDSQLGSVKLAFHEERNPLGKAGRGSGSFLIHHLPPYFNAWLTFDRSLPTNIVERDPLMPMLDRFFYTREVSLPLTFGLWCWCESVRRLQGKHRVSRMGAMLRIHAHRLLKKVKDIPREHKDSALMFKRFLRQLAEKDELYHNNPWMEGQFLMSMYENYLRLGLKVLEKSKEVRTVFQLYHALKISGLLQEPVPWLDRVISSLGESKILPSNKLKTELTATSRSDVEMSDEERRRKEDLRIHFMEAEDRRREERPTFSLEEMLWQPRDKEYLSEVMDAVSAQTRGSGILALDGKRFHEICTSILEEVKALLLNKDGDPLQLAFALLEDVEMCAEDGNLGEAFRLLQPISGAFSPDTEKVKGLYLVTNWDDLPGQEFGSQAPVHCSYKPADQVELHAFKQCMDMLERAEEPLDERQEKLFRMIVERYPKVTEVVRQMPSGHSPTSYSLVHELSAGKAASPALLDWVIQKGGEEVVFAALNPANQDKELAPPPGHLTAAAGNEDTFNMLFSEHPGE